MSFYKKIIILFFALFAVTVPTFVLADKWGIDNAAQGTDLIQTTQTIPDIIGSVIGIALSFVGIVFFLLILFGGFRWMTAFGNEEKVTSAKGIMEHAAIGLVIVLAAYAIANFVFGTLTRDIVSPAPSAQSDNDVIVDTIDGVLGCCFNPTTGNRIENLESQCVANAANPRTWEVGPCPLNDPAQPDPEPPAPPLGCCTNNNDNPPLSLEPVPEAQCNGINEVWNPVACNQQPGCCTVALNPQDIFTRPSTAPQCRGGGETWKAGPCP